MKTTTMNNIEKFNNGLSIHQLEDRYEMVVSGNRLKNSDDWVEIDMNY